MSQVAAVGLIVRFTFSTVPKVLAVTARKPEAHGTFTLPGGKVEDTDGSDLVGKQRTMLERARFALVRELQEELGVKALRHYISYLTALPGTLPGWRVYVFHVGVLTGDPRACEEGTRLQWMTIKELEQEGFYGEFYKRAFPTGIEHLTHTQIIG